MARFLLSLRFKIMWHIRVQRWYKVDREQVTIHVYTITLIAATRRDRGVNYYKFVLGAGVKAKTVTSLLIIALMIKA